MVTDMNNPNNPNNPNCCYCNEALTDNDRDSETGGFWSAHSRCSQYAPDGDYGVVTERTPEAPASRRFTTRKRAEAELDYLARANYRDSFSGSVVYVPLMQVLTTQKGALKRKG